MINIIPFGEVVESRFEEAKKYNLVEMIAGIWRLTEKCKSNYDPLSYMRYLQGRVERGEVVKVNSSKKQKTKSEEKPQYKSKNDLIKEILSM